VKGRFVKRETLEQQQQQDNTSDQNKAEKTVTISDQVSVSSIPREEIDDADPGDLEQVHNKAEDGVDEDADMPDVNDPDAGFCPTDDQPYRRLRRHTIT
jgi:hypothetical protein